MCQKFNDDVVLGTEHERGRLYQVDIDLSTEFSNTTSYTESTPQLANLYQYHCFAQPEDEHHEEIEGR